jgi:hypothetical protein
MVVVVPLPALKFTTLAILLGRISLLGVPLRGVALLWVSLGRISLLRRVSLRWVSLLGVSLGRSIAGCTELRGRTAVATAGGTVAWWAVGFALVLHLAVLLRLGKGVGGLFFGFVLGAQGVDFIEA